MNYSRENTQHHTVQCPTGEGGRFEDIGTFLENPLEFLGLLYPWKLRTKQSATPGNEIHNTALL